MRLRALAAAAALAILTAGLPAKASADAGAAGDSPAAEKPSSEKGKAPKRAGPGKTPIAGPDESPTMSAGRFEQVSEGEIVMTDEVDFRYGIVHLLADSMRYSEKSRTAIAEGNVVLQFGGSQVSGDRVEINLDTEHVSIDNARGYIEPDVILDAKKLERIGPETFRITDGNITTCTQPVPYWSFHVGSAVVTIGHYARMRNAAFRAGRVPVFWSPYLVWPVKEGRSPGLLLPHFGFTGKRGAFLSNALYLPFGRSFDATLQFDFFNGAVEGLTEQLPQTGQGLEARWIPSGSGSGSLNSYFIRERFRPEPGADVEERDRYHLNMSHTERLPAGYKLLVDFNTVSDLDYYLDFGREIRYSTSPTVFSQVDLSRQSGPLALNVRFSRQLQFLGVSSISGDPDDLFTEDLTVYRLPEIELRGRGVRLGRSPFYLSFESSLNGFARRTRAIDTATFLPETDQTTYGRFDVFPTISGNFSPAAWLDISPTIAMRETIYTASDLDPGEELDPEGPSIHRELYRVGVSVVGPRLFRLFGNDSPDSTRYKHTFEPRVAYDYVPEVTGGEKIIPFDEIDASLPSSNIVSYSLTSRLFAKRPVKKAPPAAASAPMSGPFASLILGQSETTRHQEPASIEIAGAAGSGEPAAGEVGDAGAPDPTGALSGAGPGAASGPTGGEGGTGAAGETESAAGRILADSSGEVYIPPGDSTGRGETSPLRNPSGPRDPRERVHQPGVGSVEIATFDLTQRYSLDNLKPLSSSAVLGETSFISPVEATIRFNPTYSASVDLRATYNTLHDDISAVSVSGNLRQRDLSYLRLSWFLNRDLEGAPAGSSECLFDPTRPIGRRGASTGRCFTDRSQIRLLGGFALFNRKITADLEGSYDIENSRLRDQRYRMGYNTQCCGVLVEVSKRSFTTSSLGATSETEYRFVLNLRGVGTFLDLNGRPQ